MTVVTTPRLQFGRHFPRLIGLAGGVGVGKDTIALTHLRPLGFLSAAFADELKLRAVAEGLCTYEEAWVTKPPAVRTLLQEFGMAKRRERADYWLDALYTKLRLNADRWGPELATYVITDVRFQNEVAFVQRHGGIVLKVHAPERYAANGLTDAQRAHDSERDLDGCDHLCDGILDNDPEHEGSVGVQVQAFLRAAGFLPRRDAAAAFRVGV